MVSGHHDHMPLISDNCYNYKKHMSTTPFYIRHTRPAVSKIGAKVDFVIVDLFVYLLSGSVGWHTCGIDCLKYETLYIYISHQYIYSGPDTRILFRWHTIESWFYILSLCCNAGLHTTQKQNRWNISETVNLQKTPIISPSWVRYVVSMTHHKYTVLLPWVINARQLGGSVVCLLDRYFLTSHWHYCEKHWQRSLY